MLRAPAGGLLSGVVRHAGGGLQQRGALEQFVAGGALTAVGSARISLPEYRIPAYLYSWIYACINRVARPGSTVRMGLFNEDAKTGQRQEVKDHPALLRLLDPNPVLYPSFSTMMWQCIVNLIVGGNSMLYYSQKKTSDGLPATITAFSRRNASVVRDPKTNLIAGWQIVVGQERFQVARELISHVRYPVDPDSGDLVWGVGPISALHDEMDTDGAQRVWNKSIFKNGVNLDTTLLYRPRRDQDDSWLDDKQLDALERALRDEQGGAHNAGGFRILNGPFEMVQRGALQRDVDFIASGKVTREAYAGVIGVPLILVFPDGAALAEAAVKVARVMLWEDAILPVLTMIQEVLQRDWWDAYAPGLKGYFVTEEVPALRDDMLRVADECERWARLNIPVNDLIDVYGLRFKKQPWNEEPLVSGFVTPISRIFDTVPEVPAAPAPAPIAAPADTGDTDPVDDTTDGEPTQADKDQAAEDQAAKDEQLQAAGYNLFRTKDGKRVGYRLRGRLREAYRRAFGKLWDPYEKAAAQVYGDHVAKIGAEVHQKLSAVASDARAAARASGGSGFEGLSDDDVRRGKRNAKRVMFNRDRAAKQLQKTIAPVLAQAIEAGVKSAASDLDVSKALGIDSPAVAQLLENKLSKITRIDDYVEKRIFDELSAGFARGENLADLARRLNAVMGEITSPARSRMIARTEVGGALNGGRVLEIKEQGVEKIEWMSAGDELVRHEEFNHRIDTEVVVVGRKFSNDLEFPGDPNGLPGNIINSLHPDVVVSGQVQYVLRARYAGEIVELQTASGRKITVTPEHQVLTPQGFVAAKVLREGDDVIAYASQVEDGRVGLAAPDESRAGSNDLDHEQAPARIEDAFGALAQAGTLRFRPVFGDLHGEGRRFQGEVEVVATNRSLLLHLEAELAQMSREVILEGTSMREADCARDRPLSLAEFGVALAASRGVGMVHRLGRASDLDASRYESSTQGRLVDADFLAQLLHRDSVDHVLVDRIVEVHRSSYLGFVYDLQTVGGWLVGNVAGNVSSGNGNGIVMAQCRCTVLPVVEDKTSKTGAGDTAD